MEWMLLPYKRYADFSGRASRKEFWMFALFLVLVTCALISAAVIVSPGGIQRPGYRAGSLFLIALGLFWLGSFVPYIAVHVRRFHDQDRSGWFYLLGFIPYIGGILLLVFMCRPGTPGANRFGEDPLDSGLVTVFS
ncbi:DUF805 domain-containing protein [Novosphingobium rosa]|uniref:DUF805 domain-containing protein n=1 Tax=Novosphingobium rosa TaxID=76978 RepID=UPI00082A63BE|nr:DUF805 domain-containing protein [Novosphingobium rosa]